jgi:ubiquinone/menaquinone biosynthesis C-methylase UbiE
VSAAYADVLGADDPTGAGVGQRAMISSLVPRIYERIWRPLLAPLLMAGRRDERAITLEMLAIGPGDSVLDVGCGPGNFTRAFARASGDGLAVGLDASRTMLDQAAREANPPNVRYVRGDAAALPFPDATFDAVCCFAALYFIERPLQAIDEMVRVLAPGGRVALLASVSRGPLPAGAMDAVVRRASGTRIFGSDELTRALADRGLTRIDQRVAGFAQFVSARQRQ